MARIEQRVRDLVSEDGSMEDAVETVLDHADEGEVAWTDVKGDIESGQWGRLIEKEVLVEGEAGFELADPDATREALSSDSELTTSPVDLDDVEGTSWSSSRWTRRSRTASSSGMLNSTW